MAPLIRCQSGELFENDTNTLATSIGEAVDRDLRAGSEVDISVAGYSAIVPHIFALI